MWRGEGKGRAGLVSKPNAGTLCFTPVPLHAPYPLQFGLAGRRTSPLPFPPPLLQARTISPAVWCSRPDLTLVRQAAANAQLAQLEWFRGSAPLRTAYVRRQLFFPDRKLIQYDCGKLQV